MQQNKWERVSAIGLKVMTKMIKENHKNIRKKNIRKVAQYLVNSSAG